MLRGVIWSRNASTSAYKASAQVSIPRRPLKKIRLGKARPAIYHQFDVQIELSDGSVITRKSQFPKDQIRLIQDQRNNPLWNPSRDDLVVVDATAGGNLDKFKQRYSSIFSMEETAKVAETKTSKGENTKDVAKEEKDSAIETDETAFQVDDYLSLLDDSTKQINTGKLATKKKSKK